MNISTIHFAGGCFWGTEHFFHQIKGVVSTKTGYANGNIDNPSYEMVYADDTGYAETVEVRYDRDRLPLAKLLRMYFTAIDPTSVNRQGEDSGTRYRTGIYYSDPNDLQTILKAYEELRKDLGCKPAVEVEALGKWYPAEEYHQAYLKKNPEGYCHLPVKLFAYAKMFSDLEAMLGDEPDVTARMAECTAMISERLGFFWTGFYVVRPAIGGEGEELTVGPFQGPAACIRIQKGRGVCGTAWAQDRTQVVPDVEKFPGHIACSSLSRSEIVVPVHDSEGVIKAVLDIDSKELCTFDRIDRLWLEMVSELIYIQPARHLREKV